MKVCVILAEEVFTVIVRRKKEWKKRKKRREFKGIVYMWKEHKRGSGDRVESTSHNAYVGISEV